MLQVRDLSKSYGPATVLVGVSFVINDNERVGLIGPNGAGKTTLLRCILGMEHPDAGVIVRSPPDMAIGYLAQALELPDDLTVGAYLEQMQADSTAAEQALQHAAEGLATAADMQAAMTEYDAALARFDALGGYEREHRAVAILDGLELAAIPRDRPLGGLSGGQKTRLGLAGLLLGEPDLLLLDEPTNHLDVAALEWLEGFVTSYPRAVLVVSHDRVFLDATVTRILYLDPVTRQVKSYAGTYSDFADTREQEREQLAEAYKKQQEYISKVETDIARLKGQALSVELSTTPSQPTIRRYAKKVAKKARSRERKLERYLEAEERVEKPKNQWGLKLDFGPAPEGGRAVLRIEDLSFAYPDSPPLLQHVSFDVQYGERIALVGPNGAGKTTLLKLIAGQLEPLHGRIRVGANVRMGVLAQEHEMLDLERTVLETVMRARPMSETEARNFLHFFLFGGDNVFRPVGACSFGERSRLQLALLVLGGCNLLLLDEPLNHLDIEGREHFEQALDAFEGTVIAVAHDRAFVQSFAERLLEVAGGHVVDRPA